MTFHPDSLPDLTGKVYIVTGGTSGIGYHTVHRLAEKGAHVYLCARNATKAQDTINKLKLSLPKAQLSYLEFDHKSLGTVVAAAKNFLSKETELHGLINNAGVMCTPFEITKDGHEGQWQINYLAHWVLTSHLLPVLLKTSKSLPAGSVRIVNITSDAHSYAPKAGINFEDTSLPKASNMERYGQSKLANLLHSKALHHLYGPNSLNAKTGKGEIWTSSINPGLVETSLADKADFPTGLLPFLKLFRRFLFVDGDTGSWTSLYCAVSPLMTSSQSGTYFQRIARPGTESKLGKDLDLAQKLEEWTENLMRKEGWVDSN